MHTEHQVLTAAAASLTTTLNVQTVAADAITLSFQTMPGNQPNTYGNFAGIWQNTDSIPWNTEPLKTIAIPNNTPSGSLVFNGLQVNNNSYIVGFSVGTTLTVTGNIQKYGNICSTAFIPAIGGGANTLLTPSITNILIGSTSVVFDFSLPDGITPQTNGAWAALWRGENPAYYTTAPLSSINISPDQSSGTMGFSNVSIGRGLSYTIAIFMSGYIAAGGSTQRALACSASFTN